MIWSCVIGAILIGWAPIFVRWIELGPSLTGFYRCMGGALVLLPFAFLTTPLWSVIKSPRKVPGYLKFAAIAGILFGLDLAAWHRSVHLLGAGMSTVLGNTQVFHVAWIGVLFFNERIQRSFFLYLFVGFVGLYLLVGDRPENISSNEYAWGVSFGLITGILYAGFMTFLRKVEKSLPLNSNLRVPAFANLGVVMFFSALTLAVISTLTQEWQMPTLRDFVAIIGLVMVPQVLGWILITRSLSKIPVSLAGLIILLQPLVASMLGVIIFDEIFTSLQILGGSLLLYAIYRGSVVRYRA